jgi:sialic acid synthase SpsE/sugar phosphate isomerase/epimerase
MNIYPNDKKFLKYVVTENESNYDAYIKLLSNDQNTLFIIKKNKILGSLTLGDFQRNFGDIFDFTKLNTSKKKIKDICNRNFFFLKKNHSTINTIHLAVPVLNNLNNINFIVLRESPEHQIKIGNNIISKNNLISIISEIGVNHNGSMKQAKKLIYESFKAKADFVKFQYRNMQSTYINKNTDTDTDTDTELSTEITLDNLKKVNFSIKQLAQLFKYAKKFNIEPLCTPFDIIACKEILRLKPKAIKIASADLLNFPLIKFAANTSLPLILSTGMHSEVEILKAVNYAKLYTTKIIVMHCVSNYPASQDSLNLNYIKRLEKITGCLIGYSSHDIGNDASIVAAGLGANIIEKHLTLNKNALGPDHRASIEPKELIELVKSLKSIRLFLGNGEKNSINQGERLNKSNLSKSLYLANELKKDSIIKRNDLICRSPGIGVPCYNIDFLVGKKINKKKDQFSLINFSDISSLKSNMLINSPKKTRWGIPARFRDYEDIISLFNPEFIEFHLTYKDLKYDLKKIKKLNNIGVKIHSPETFENNFIIDLASNNKVILNKSIKCIKRVIDFSNEIIEITNNKKIINHLIINPGGHTSFRFANIREKKKLFKNLIKSFNKLNFKKIVPLIQSMPPYPWHFGGRRYHNLFVGSSDFKNWYEETGIKFCLDISHTGLAANFFNQNIYNYIDRVKKYCVYYHVSDCFGKDEEGLQINDGILDFKKILKLIKSKNNQPEFIPEIWNGHLNNYEGFRIALDRLSEYGW